MSVCIAGIIIHCLTKQYNPPVFIGNMLCVCITYTESEKKKLWRARLITSDSKLKTNSLRDLNIVMYIMKAVRLWGRSPAMLYTAIILLYFQHNYFWKLKKRKRHIYKKEHVPLYKLYFYNIEQCIKIKEMFKFKSSNIRI